MNLEQLKRDMLPFAMAESPDKQVRHLLNLIFRIWQIAMNLSAAREAKISGDKVKKEHHGEVILGRLSAIRKAVARYRPDFIEELQEEESQEEKSQREESQNDELLISELREGESQEDE